MLKHIVLIVLATFAVSLISGCDSADVREIKRVYAALGEYAETGNGGEAVKLYTDDSFPEYERLIGIALDGIPRQVRALGPVDKFEVLTMRLLASRSQLEGLTGRQYVVFATSQRWYASLPGDVLAYGLTNFRIGVNDATAEVVLDGERMGVRERFVKVNGAWKYDERSSVAGWDAVLYNAARDMGVTIDEAVIEWLEEQFQRNVPETIWQPMPRGR